MRLLLAGTALAALLAVASGGSAPFGRVLLAAGLPGWAGPFFADPAWRGVAAYRAGDMEAAAAGFREAGDFHNLGNAEAMRGAYAAALEAYDIAIAMGDADARANFDLVFAVYGRSAIDPEALSLFPERGDGPTAEAPTARGDARAAGTGDEVTNASTMLGRTELASHEQQGVRRVYDDLYMMADERWLQQLSDVPGAWLKARIAAEHKARAEAGLSPPQPEDPR
ncbi:hypothetical protein [Mangrovicoccus sp. HB161399]|uniref:hypothetical protein n=1 Tax=Mangrovicoccus sp. HB161399 TaxID=2720392 RepID=UPI00155398C9|nr:hypothetical protein [Mangrovicoccus sp. HB161399]